MKRGLKADSLSSMSHRVKVTFLAPMKRGLKAHISVVRGLTPFRNIPCPDEKGTESHTFGYLVKSVKCNIPCPDEKGTESAVAILRFIAIIAVTFLAPMKRGLKALINYQGKMTSIT